MPGVNLKSKGRLRLRQLFYEYMIRNTPAGGPPARNRGTGFRRAKYPTFYLKSGVPASNTAADAPDRAGQICLDYTNKDVYLCTAFTNSTTFTWTKISD